MPNPKRNTIAVNVRLDVDLIAKLKSTNAAITVYDPITSTRKFAHGALSRYLTRLIREDLGERESASKAIDNLLTRGEGQ